MSMDRPEGEIPSASPSISEESLPALDKDMVRTAVRLCQLGWSVIPLHRETKVACVRWSEYQHRRPTVHEVGRWLVVQFRGCNYAVITGATSGVVFVEADDETAVRLLHEKFPPTPLRQGSRKGEHWGYRHPGVPVGNRVRCSVGGTRYALDLRGDGGLIVGPGSTHASGHVYAEIEPWTAEALARTPVFDPTWIDPKPTTAAGRRRSPSPVRLPGRGPDALAVPLDVRLRKAKYWLNTGRHGEPIPGTRQGEDASGRCFWVACRLIQGFALSPDEALAVFAEWGEREDQLDEAGGWYPWSEGELYHKLTDADRGEDRDGPPRGYMLGRVHPPVDPARLKSFVFAARL